MYFVPGTVPDAGYSDAKGEKLTPVSQECPAQQVEAINTELGSKVDFLKLFPHI